MKKNVLVHTLVLLFVVFISSCSKDNVGGEGPEGSGGEGGNESGVLWNIGDTADETINGLRLIISWDSTTSSFIGTLENTNTTTMTATRIEVHIFDANNVSTEYGPTTPVDMSPGEIRNVSLTLPTGAVFVKFNMHPEFGNGSSGS